MSLKLMFENFADIVAAPGGVAKLRESILKLAMQGELVPQDPDDEPAEELLKQIFAQKELLIAKGAIKRDKPLHKIVGKEMPYELPEGWKWVRLLELCETITKGSSPRWQGVNYVEGREGVLFITSENVGNYNLLLHSRKYVEEKFNDIEPRSILRVGDFLMNIVGASIGRTAVFDLDEIANINQAVCLIRTVKGFIHQPYLLHFLNSNICLDYMFDKQVDCARANLSMGNIGRFLIPMPPIAEQRRIVDKIDELFALCNQIEAHQTLQVEKHQHWVESVVNHLMSVQNESEFSRHWEHITKHFDMLLSSVEAVKEFRQAVLQLAVQGKLVEQSPNDEPVAILLKGIRKSKEILVADGNARRGKTHPDYTNKDVQFQLPAQWEWAKLGELCSLITDGEHSTPTRISPSIDAIPLATAKNIRDGYIDLADTDFVALETANKCWRRCKPLHGDILMVCVGATTGRLTVCQDPEAMVLVRSVALIRPQDTVINPHYLGIVLKSRLGQKQIWRNVKQSAQPCLYLGRIEIIDISLPPLAEQKRIVAKVDEMMSLCDQLEQRVWQTKEAKKCLMEAVVRKIAG